MNDQNMAPQEIPRCPKHAPKWLLLLLGAVGGVAIFIIIIMIARYATFSNQSYDDVFVPEGYISQDVYYDLTEDADNSTNIINEENQNESPNSEVAIREYDRRIKFSYLNGWHINAEDTIAEGDPDLKTQILVSQDPVWECAACGGPITPIMISIVNKPAGGYGIAGSAFAYELGEFTNIKDYTNLTTDDLPNGSQTFSANVSDEYLGDYTYGTIVYEGNDQVVLVRFYDWGQSNDLTKGWETIINSLDFSEIK
ncbi:hypothetical protein KJ758_01800 [Patescibacteria group bacterium]|nr:hypothetical protein [Patescibacteria group bacterium]